MERMGPFILTSKWDLKHKKAMTERMELSNRIDAKVIHYPEPTVKVLLWTFKERFMQATLFHQKAF
jgi:hypothetical protein